MNQELALAAKSHDISDLTTVNYKSLLDCEYINFILLQPALLLVVYV